jgi:hypothetical protein
MRLLLMGPLDPKQSKTANASMREVLGYLENCPDIDTSLIWTSIQAPVSPFVASKMGYEPVAPFDVSLIIHEQAHIWMDEAVFTSAQFKFAYVTHLNPNAHIDDLTYLRRVNAFAYLIPATARIGKALEGLHPRITEPQTPAQLVDFLSAIKTDTVPFDVPTYVDKVSDTFRQDYQVVTDYTYGELSATLPDGYPDPHGAARAHLRLNGPERWADYK